MQLYFIIYSIHPFQTEDGKLVVTMKYPHFFPVSQKCRVSSTRLAITKAFSSICMGTNTPILEEMIAIRHKIAHILGYESHAAYAQEVRACPI